MFLGKNESRFSFNCSILIPGLILSVLGRLNLQFLVQTLALALCRLPLLHAHEPYPAFQPDQGCIPAFRQHEIGKGVNLSYLLTKRPLTAISVDLKDFHPLTYRDRINRRFDIAYFVILSGSVL